MLHFKMEIVWQKKESHMSFRVLQRFNLIRASSMPTNLYDYVMSKWKCAIQRFQKFMRLITEPEHRQKYIGPAKNAVSNHPRSNETVVEPNLQKKNTFCIVECINRLNMRLVYDSNFFSRCFSACVNRSRGFHFLSALYQSWIYFLLEL